MSEQVKRELVREAAEYVNHEARLEGIRERRKQLALTMLGLGFSERAVADLAGVSGSAVHQWKVSA
jgi:transposase